MKLLGSEATQQSRSRAATDRLCSECASKQQMQRDGVYALCAAQLARKAVGCVKERICKALLLAIRCYKRCITFCRLHDLSLVAHLPMSSD